MFLVTSPIVIGLVAVETIHAINQWLANSNIKRNMTSVCKQDSRLSSKRRSAFRTGAMIYLSEENILGLGALSSLSLFTFPLNL